jgi:hypothetical protein
MESLNIEKRFFFDTEREKLFLFDGLHVDYFHNHKGKELSLDFDDYIRGIVKNNILYLRVYYPYADIQELSFETLIEKSNALLGLYQEAIIKALDAQGVTIDGIRLSVTNENLKAALNSAYV